jgi:hypothetical protein
MKSSFMSLGDVSATRAKKVASAPNAKEPGKKSRSTDPNGVDFATVPALDVGEYCPLVKP